jgi:hypothetical protein
MWRHAAAQTRDTVGEEAISEATDRGEAHPGSDASKLRSAAPIACDDTADRQACLQQSLDEFRSAHTDSVQSATRVISPLLDLWSLAAAVDRRAAAPIERLLTALVVRTATTGTELLACIDEIDAVLTRFSVGMTPQRDVTPQAEPLGRLLHTTG